LKYRRRFVRFTLAVNLKAPYLLIQAALPYFRNRGGGRILNIGSVNGYCGERNQFAYSISKGGLTTLTRNLADAYGPEGIRVNQFNFGWTLTPNEFELKKKEGLPADWPTKISKTYAPLRPPALPGGHRLGGRLFPLR